MARGNEDMGAMNRERMTAILEAYGAAPARWPEAERAAAKAWAEAHAEDFAAMARGEAALDGMLACDEREGDDAALMARVLASAPKEGVVVRPVFGRGAAHGPTGSIWRQASALAACAVLGLAIGFANAPADDDAAYEMDAAFGAAFEMPGADMGAGVGGAGVGGDGVGG
jgi:hypothetical protein